MEDLTYTLRFLILIQFAVINKNEPLEQKEVIQTMSYMNEANMSSEAKLYVSETIQRCIWILHNPKTFHCKSN